MIISIPNKKLPTVKYYLLGYEKDKQKETENKKTKPKKKTKKIKFTKDSLRIKGYDVEITPMYINFILHRGVKLWKEKLSLTPFQKNQIINDENKDVIKRKINWNLNNKIHQRNITDDEKYKFKILIDDENNNNNYYENHYYYNTTSNFNNFRKSFNNNNNKKNVINNKFKNNKKIPFIFKRNNKINNLKIIGKKIETNNCDLHNYLKLNEYSNKFLNNRVSENNNINNNYINHLRNNTFNNENDWNTHTQYFHSFFDAYQHYNKNYNNDSNFDTINSKYFILKNNEKKFNQTTKNFTIHKKNSSLSDYETFDLYNNNN